MTDAQSAPAESLEVRSRLVEAPRLDVVGLWADADVSAEQLPGRERPPTWRLARFPFPTGTPPDRSRDVDEDDAFDTGPETVGLTEESNEEHEAARCTFFPFWIPMADENAKGPTQ